MTIRYAGLAGLKIGMLLEAAEAACFDVLLTVDQSIRQQQNLAGLHLATVVMSALTNRLVQLLLLIPAVLSSLESIEPGQVAQVQLGQSR